MYEGIRLNGFGPNDEEYAQQVGFLGRGTKSIRGIRVGFG